MFRNDNDGNFYWNAFKTAFAIAGGAAVAGTVVRIGYKILKKGAESIAENRPAPIEEEKDVVEEEKKDSE
jgi:hypothetical protein